MKLEDFKQGMTVQYGTTQHMYIVLLVHEKWVVFLNKSSKNVFTMSNNLDEFTPYVPEVTVKYDVVWGTNMNKTVTASIVGHGKPCCAGCKEVKRETVSFTYKPPYDEQTK